MKYLYYLFGWCLHDFSKWETIYQYDIIWEQTRVCNKCGFRQRENIYGD